MPSMPRLAPVATAAAALALVACSADAEDFKETAEEYIESRGFSEEAGLLRLTEVECQEPDSTDQDTRYTCDAVAEDGSTWRFAVEIVGEADLKVIVPPAELVGGTVTPAPDASSAPDQRAPTSTTASGSATTRPAAPTTTRPAPTPTTRPAPTTTRPAPTPTTRPAPTTTSA
jgi:hypothetical protein